MFDSYLRESILFRAQKKKLIKFNILNIRDFTADKHHKVDDKPFGGGPGMVIKVEPIFNALKALNKKAKKQESPPTGDVPQGHKKARVILLSAKGKTFDAKEAKRLSKYDELTFICGRYEGVDERVAKYLADEEISIGNYVLTGGELPAMIIIDAISRFIPGVLGKSESLIEESFTPVAGEPTADSRQPTAVREYPHYTRPEVFSPKKGVKWAVPKILLSGNYKKIKEWRDKQKS
mgnify:CR=1 FL=1